MQPAKVIVQAVHSDVLKMKREAAFLANAIINLIEPCPDPDTLLTIQPVVQQMIEQAIKNAYVLGANTPREDFWEEHSVIDAEFVEIVEAGTL